MSREDSVYRYAIYALPGALGSDDAIEAVRVRAAAESWFAREDLGLQGFTTSARRYGFHATLKAPFRLAEGRTERELREAAEAFAAGRSSATITAIAPRAISEFRALVPTGDQTSLNDLAAAVVREFDEFRAPLTAEETERRAPHLLSTRQRELLETWGYPYTLDEFRFHLTLTDRLPAEQAPEIDAALNAQFGDLTGLNVPVRSISIFFEPEPGAPFEILSTHPLAANPAASHPMENN